MKGRIPTAKDISPTGGQDLDEQCALRHFLGQDVEGALVLLHEAFDTYQEDLLFMGRRAFVYYLPALLAYLRELVAEESDELGDAADTAFMLLESRLRSEGGTDFYRRHYAMTPAELAANGHACALRELCCREWERRAVPGRAQRWRRLF